MPTPISWPLIPDPASPIPTPATAAANIAAINTSRGLPSFLGQGIIRPFRRDKKNDFASGAGVALVVSCVGQILGTKANSATHPGELPWRTDFGSQIHILRHRNNSKFLADFATVMVQAAVARWEPRVAVVRVAIEDTLEPRKLLLRVTFNIVDRGGRVVLANQEAVVPIELAAA